MRFLILAWLLVALPGQALAWSATGHRLISSLAMTLLPDELPGSCDVESGKKPLPIEELKGLD